MNKRKKVVLALDQGTTSTRAIIFDENGAVVSCAQQEFTQVYPRPGWVEHNPQEILGTVRTVVKRAAETGYINVCDIEAVGLTNQRETVVLWDADTGVPVYNAIVWQCRRTAAYCKSMDEETQRRIYEKTGLMPDAYFSATKIKWILENVSQARRLAESGKLRAGTIDTYLLYCLSGGKIFATDYTNASRTMLFNIHTKEWDEELLRLFGVRREMLPQAFPSGHLFGYVSFGISEAKIPVCAVAGDQQAALYGQRGFACGAVKCTFGTGCFLLCNTGEAFASKRGLLTTLAIGESGKSCYALEGSVFTAGAAVQWLRDEMRLIKTAAESEDAAFSVPDSGGVYVVPAFVGLGAPYWDSDARGTICGLTRGSTRAHVIRATLESIAYQTADVLHAVRRDTGLPFDRLAVDGGASANNFLMQFLADIADVTVVRPRIRETTARGVAVLAAETYGGGCARMGGCDFTDRVFTPRIVEEKRRELLIGWKTAVARARYK